MAGPTSTKTPVKKPKVSGSSAPVLLTNQLNPVLPAAHDTALLLIERLEKKVDKIDDQLSSHHDELTSFKASFDTIKKIAAFVGVVLGLWLAYLSGQDSRKAEPKSAPPTTDAATAAKAEKQPATAAPTNTPKKSSKEN